MNTNLVTKRQRNLWRMAAMAVPLARAAACCSWPAVLAMGSLTLLVGWWLAGYRAEQKPWLDILQGLWAAVIVSQMLYWCGDCWPSHRNGKAAALILLALSVWSAGKERQRAARVGCILLWPVGLLLGTILLPAIPEVRLSNLYPTWQMPDASLVTILLLTTLYAGTGREASAGVCGGLLGVALITAVVTAGVLSPAVSSGSAAGLYELSRSISSQRLESVAAVGMTIGYFGGISYLLSIPEEAANRGRMVLAYGALAGLLYLLDIRVDSRLIAVGSILLWVMIPVISSIKALCQNPPSGEGEQKSLS